MGYFMEKLRFYFQWWQEYELPKFINRTLPLNLFDLRLIPALIGPRRSGKSTIFFQMIKQLMAKIPRQNILYINFEDDRLLPLDGSELSQLLDIYRQSYQPNKKYKIYLFLDEVQNVPRWEHAVRRIYETEASVQIFITGSNSKMLGSDLATALRGRTLSIKIFPLDFKEFLTFKSTSLPDLSKLEYSPQRNELLFLFDEYLSFGGFPEVVLSNDNDIKELILKEYIHTIFFADIIQRYGIRNVKLMDSYLKILIRQMASLFSFGKISSSLKSIGFKAAKSTLVEYFGFIESAFLGKGIPIYSYSIKDQMQYPRKFYLLDNGLYRAVSFLKSEDRGRLLENLVFVHLLRKYEDIYYWKSTNGFEVDFVIPENFSAKEKIGLIQVCFDFENETVKKREIRSLVRAAKELKQTEALIITRNNWETITLDNLKIHVLPFIQWALE